MLNQLTLHRYCIITTDEGDSVTGIYGGVETPHGDWSVLVRQDTDTRSIPLDRIQAAAAAACT